MWVFSIHNLCFTTDETLWMKWIKVVSRGPTIFAHNIQLHHQMLPNFVCACGTYAETSDSKPKWSEERAEVLAWYFTLLHLHMQECGQWSTKRAGKVAAAQTGLWVTWSQNSQAQLVMQPQTLGPHRCRCGTLPMCGLLRAADELHHKKSYFQSKAIELHVTSEGHWRCW